MIDQPTPLSSQAPSRDPVTEAYKAGIDRSLLRANLARTPTQRVENLMALQRLAAEARRSGRQPAR
jgi:hypothetical protein